MAAKKKGAELREARREIEAAHHRQEVSHIDFQLWMFSRVVACISMIILILFNLKPVFRFAYFGRQL